MTTNPDTPQDAESTAPSQGADAAERDKLLHEIWCEQAKAIRDILKSTPPGKLKASFINAVNGWLRLNDTSNSTIPDADRDARKQGALVQKIRALTPDGDEGPVRVDVEKAKKF